MKELKILKYFTLGFGLFSMFFGAGNIVFPLSLGKTSQDQNVFAVLGLVLTAVIVPFLGLLSMMLFKANYKEFFGRLGKWPGFLLTIGIFSFLGPFGAIPRCIALMNSTLKEYIGEFSLTEFSLFTCFLIYLSSFRKDSVIKLLGNIFTPLILICLSLIVMKGIDNAPMPSHSSFSKMDSFLLGLKEGYQTLDLISSFFFCSLAMNFVRKIRSREGIDEKKQFKLALIPCMIGASMLAVVYVSFSYLASFYSQDLNGIPPEKLLNILCIKLLGPFGTFISCICVSFACFTTAIALATVFADFMKKDVFKDNVGYKMSLIITLTLSFIVSTMDFTGITRMLLPFTQVCYPGLLVLTLLNILNKFFGFKPVKIPVYCTFIVSLLSYFFC